MWPGCWQVQQSPVKSRRFLAPRRMAVLGVLRRVLAASAVEACWFFSRTSIRSINLSSNETSFFDGSTEATRAFSFSLLATSSSSGCTTATGLAVGGAYDSISRVEATASSKLFGRRCLTLKATCGWSNCARYVCRERSSCASGWSYG